VGVYYHWVAAVSNCDVTAFYSDVSAQHVLRAAFSLPDKLIQCGLNVIDIVPIVRAVQFRDLPCCGGDAIHGGVWVVSANHIFHLRDVPRGLNNSHTSFTAPAISCSATATRATINAVN
jgi:hypothetical protein